VTEIIRHLPPESKERIQASNPIFKRRFVPRMSLLSENYLRSFKVRRFRIVYELDRKARVLRIFAIGHRREIYEQLAERLRQVGEHK
jgi:mRNA interferase RelE/StbE